ncbi:MAG: glycosyltransferase family 39 protein [Thioalkalispiraceae bacterium]
MFFSRLSTAQSLFILIGVSVFIKVAMALILPITGDEAYFIVWGNHLDYGYYDHPPMVGWWLAALLQVSDHPLWLRLPSILATTLIGWMIYRVVYPRGKTNAVIAAGLYWLAPVHLLAPLITTDTPLIFFAFLSAISFYKAQRHDRYHWYLLAGLLLGLAFFSKFFAGMLGIAYLAYVVLFVRRGVKPYNGILFVILGTLPFIGLNLHWNYQHCWDNYLFNLINRTGDASFSLWTMGKYLLLLAYVVTPPIIFYIVRKPASLIETMRNGGLGLFLALFVIPIVLFLGLSLFKSIGLHWLLSFYPFLFIAVIMLLHFGQLRVCFYFMWGFSLLHVLAFAIVYALSPGIFKDNESNYQKIVLAMYTPQLLELIDSQRYNFTLATPSYSESAILAYHTREDVLVLGPGSHHGRQDDINTDLRKYEGKGIAILMRSEQVKKYAKYFNNFTHVILPFKETEYHLGLGIGFKYEVYDQEVLQKIRENFYQIPDWLPTGSCYMYERG